LPTLRPQSLNAQAYPLVGVVQTHLPVGLRCRPLLIQQLAKEHFIAPQNHEFWPRHRVVNEDAVVVLFDVDIFHCVDQGVQDHGESGQALLSIHHLHRSSGVLLRKNEGSEIVASPHFQSLFDIPKEIVNVALFPGVFALVTGNLQRFTGEEVFDLGCAHHSSFVVQVFSQKLPIPPGSRPQNWLGRWGL